MQITFIDTVEDAQVRICRHKKSGDFALIHHCRYKWPFSAVEFGRVEHIPAKEFLANGFKIVVQSLLEFPKRQKSSPSELDALPHEAQRRFEAEYFHVRVAVTEGGVTAEPFKRGNKGYVATNSNGKKLFFPIDATQFNAALLKVLEKAD